MGRHITSVELEREIGELAGLPRADLIERWQELYRSDPPKGLSSQLLIGAITYEMQARQYGGLNPPWARARRVRLAPFGNRLS